MSENKSMLGLPNRQFLDTRQEILDLLENIVPKGGLKYKNEELVRQLIDAAVMEIGWIWFGAMSEETRQRLLNPTKESESV